MPKFKPGDRVTLDRIKQAEFTSFWKGRWQIQPGTVDSVETTERYCLLVTVRYVSGNTQTWHSDHLTLCRPLGPPENTRDMSYKVLEEAGYATV